MFPCSVYNNLCINFVLAQQQVEGRCYYWTDIADHSADAIQFKIVM